MANFSWINNNGLNLKMGIILFRAIIKNTFLPNLSDWVPVNLSRGKIMYLWFSFSLNILINFSNVKICISSKYRIFREKNPLHVYVRTMPNLEAWGASFLSFVIFRGLIFLQNIRAWHDLIFCGMIFPFFTIDIWSIL